MNQGSTEIGIELHRAVDIVLRRLDLEADGYEVGRAVAQMAGRSNREAIRGLIAPCVFSQSLSPPLACSSEWIAGIDSLQDGILHYLQQRVEWRSKRA